MQTYSIPKINSSLFDWSTWRRGSVHDLDIAACRYELLTSSYGKGQLRKYAIGYCHGESLPCRPKINEMAVMCQKEDIVFWFHLRDKEFETIFNTEHKEEENES